MVFTGYKIIYSVLTVAGYHFAVQVLCNRDNSSFSVDFKLVLSVAMDELVGYFSIVALQLKSLHGQMLTIDNMLSTYLV